MKYLKTFESSTVETTYRIITNAYEMKSIDKIKEVNMSQIVIDTVTSKYKKFKIQYHHLKYQERIGSLFLKNDRYSGNIFELPDEWFIAEFYPILEDGCDVNYIFLCDQLDGLEKCLNDKKENFGL